MSMTFGKIDRACMPNSVSGTNFTRIDACESNLIWSDLRLWFRADGSIPSQLVD